ncbi:MAG: hypothetical protein ACO20Z_05755, partial [Ilumatobacteraceae bacterium]
MTLSDGAVPQPKDASPHTVAANRKAAHRTPDPADLERVRRGHIASLSSTTIDSPEVAEWFDAGPYVWNLMRRIIWLEAIRCRLKLRRRMKGCRSGHSDCC